jgi:hypothetical protein
MKTGKKMKRHPAILVKSKEVCDTYSVEETAAKIGKSKQTVRSYVRRGLLELSANGGMGFRITSPSIDELPSKLHASLQTLRQQRSQYMRDQWQKMKTTA